MRQLLIALNILSCWFTMVGGKAFKDRGGIKMDSKYFR